MRPVTLAIGLLTALAGCVTNSSRSPDAVPAMQMPAKPANTGRVVLFRLDSPNSKEGISLRLNSENLGDIGEQSLTIRDVTPGEYRIATVRADGSELESLVARIDTGDEWYIETEVTRRNCTGIRPVGQTRTGVLEADAVLGAGALLVNLAALATTRCETVTKLSPAWPQTARWRLNPLLQKAGASPQAYTEASGEPVPQSDLPWRDAERAIRYHFEANGEKYKPFVDAAGRGSLVLKDIRLTGGNDSATTNAYDLPVELEYLHVDEDTLVGKYVRRPIRYVLRRDSDVVAVDSWRDFK